MAREKECSDGAKLADDYGFDGGGGGEGSGLGGSWLDGFWLDGSWRY